MNIPDKTIEDYFIDWHAEVFGYGYGSGEPYIIPLLNRFLRLCARFENNAYDYEVLESELGAEQTWLLINILCKEDMIEYGTSPRFGWLTECGQVLRTFVTNRTNDKLLELVTGYNEHHTLCSPESCNCGERGYVEGRVCRNPFWHTARRLAEIREADKIL